MERMACGQHRAGWRGQLPGAGGAGRHPAAAVRLHQRLLGHPGHGGHHLRRRPAHQHLRRTPRAGHGSAHARRGLRLHRQHGHQPHLRQLHLHLLCAGSGHHGLRAGAGLRHPARLGLSGVRAGGHPDGHARRHGAQPLSGLDAAPVAPAAGRALRLCLSRPPHPGGRAAGLCGAGRPGWRIQPLALRRRADGRRGADHADGRTGGLPALHAREDRRQSHALVGRCSAGRTWLGAARCAEDAGRRAAGHAGAEPVGAGRTRGGSQPDVPGGLRARVPPLRLGGGRHGAAGGGEPAQDQRHQRLRRQPGLEQFLCPRHAQPPRARGVDGVQHPHRPDADGAGSLQGHRRRAGPVQQHRHQLDHGRGGRPGGEQAAGPVAQGHRVPARPPVRHQPGGRGRDGRGFAAVGAGPRGAVRATGAGLLGGDRDGRGVCHRATDRLGSPAAATTWRASPKQPTWAAACGPAAA
jgi:hypothetical protein